MRERVIEYLTALGVTGAGEDPLTDMCITIVTERIRNLVNRTELPEGLTAMAVRMAAGEYIQYKKAAGCLEGFDLEVAVKQIQEGDTSVTFAIGEGSSTPEQRLAALVEYLRGENTAEIFRYRRLVW